MTTATVIAAPAPPSLAGRTFALVAAPVVAVAARAVWVPYEEDDPGRYLEVLGRHPDRADAGALLMMLSALLFIPAAFALAAMLRERRPVMARVAVSLIVTGAVGLAALCTIALTATELARRSDRAAMTEAWDVIFAKEAGHVVFLAVLAGVAGFVVMAVGLFRARAVPRPAAVLIGLGGAATLFTAGGPERPLLLAAAAVALAGFAWAAATQSDS